MTTLKIYMILGLEVFLRILWRHLLETRVDKYYSNMTTSG
jgi:hypothetical protein